ncbi:hypothetical protein NFJ02_06g127320 [Pycnococcus provasolii]
MASPPPAAAAAAAAAAAGELPLVGTKRSRSHLLLELEDSSLSLEDPSLTWWNQRQAYLQLRCWPLIIVRVRPVFC